MRVFSLKSWIHVAAWSLAIGISLFAADRTIDFKNLGVVRCGAGSYIFPVGAHAAGDCADKGLLDNVVNGNVWLTLSLWIFLAFSLLGLRKAAQNKK